MHVPKAGALILFLYFACGQAWAASVPDWPGIIQSFQPNILSLFDRDRGSLEKIGNGIITSSDGLVITTERSVRGVSKVRARNSEKRWYNLEVIGSDRISNLALLRIRNADGAGLNSAPLKWAAHGDLKRGHQAAVILHDGNSNIRHQLSLIRELDQAFSWGPHDSFIEILDDLNHWDRGAALVDANGRLSGIFTATVTGVTADSARGIFIPAETIRTVIRQLDETGHIQRSWLGIQIRPVGLAHREELGLDRNQGIAVSWVNRESPAARAGLRPGDILLAFNHVPLDAMRVLPQLVARSPSGVSYPLTVIRGGKHLTLTTILAERVR